MIFSAAMFPRIRFRAFAATAAFCCALMAMTPATYAGTVVFDNFTGRTLSSTSSTPNTFMGDGYVLLAGTTNISEIAYFPVNLSGTSFTGIQTTFYFWDTVNTGTVNAGSPAFGNLLGTYTDTVAGSFASGFYYPLDYVLPAPLSIADTTIGLTMNVQGTTNGITYNSVNNLTDPILYGASGPSVGSNVFNGYFRNANSETDGNFTSATRSIGQPNQSIGFILYTSSQAVPEPGSPLLLGGGIAVLAFFRRRLVRR